VLNLFTIRNFWKGLIILGLGSVAPELAIAQNSEGQPWPTTITPTTPAARDRLTEGTSLIQQGNVEAAIAQFQQAIALDSQLWEAHYNLGLARGQGGDLRGAAEAFSRTIALQPGFAVAYANLGGVLIDSKNWPQAEAYIQRALALDPELAIAHYNLGLIRRHQGQTEAAIQAWQRARQLAPSFAEAGIQLAELYLEGDRLEAAQPLIEQLRRSEGDLAATHYLQGRLLTRQGNFPGALQAFRTSSERDPTYANAYFAAAQVLMATGRGEAAAPLLDYALALYNQEGQTTWVQRVKALRQQL
jgi:tetratricopeptide (TPR) repeat protein